MAFEVIALPRAEFEAWHLFGSRNRFASLFHLNYARAKIFSRVSAAANATRCVALSRAVADLW